MTDATLTTEEITIGTCECGACGAEYDFETSEAEHTDECPTCTAKEEAKNLEVERHEQEVEDAQGELDEADSDLEGMMTEMQELRERIAEAKAKKRAAKKKLAKLGA